MLRWARSECNGGPRLAALVPATEPSGEGEHGPPPALCERPPRMGHRTSLGDPLSELEDGGGRERSASGRAATTQGVED